MKIKLDGHHERAYNISMNSAANDLAALTFLVNATTHAGKPTAAQVRALAAIAGLAGTAKLAALVDEAYTGRAMMA